MSWRAGVTGMLLFLGGCSGCERGRGGPGGAGAEAEGNAGARSAGAGGDAAQGGDAASGAADGGPFEYRVSIEASRIEVCAGECVELTAHAEHGRAPYRYAWTDEIGDGAGPHEVCPAETTAYSVVAHDTGTDGGELDQASREALASVQIIVDDDDTCEPDFDGGVLDPTGTSVSCSVRVPFESPALFYSINSWSGYASVGIDDDGSAYLLGMFQGSIDLGAQTITATGENAVVLKYDASCQLV
jgi:hypothetical protein